MAEETVLNPILTHTRFRCYVRSKVSRSPPKNILTTLTLTLKEINSFVFNKIIRRQTETDQNNLLAAEKVFRGIYGMEEH